MMILRTVGLAVLALWGQAVWAETAAPPMELLMIEQDGCHWCARWNDEIAPVYPKTAEAAAAPLRRIEIHDPVPEDIKLSRPAVFTPTFVLTLDGAEVGRIEGYPGADFFWALLGQMIHVSAAATTD